FDCDWSSDVCSSDLGHTPEIELTGPNAARGVWWMQTVHRPADVAEHGERVVHGYGYYEEEYRREAGGWRISFLRLTLLREDSLRSEERRVGKGWRRE